MAYIDVKKYYFDIEKQYFNLLDYTKKVEEEYKAGRISEDLFHEFERDLNVIKTNYERISYVMYLFNLPKSKKKAEKKNLESLYNYSSLAEGYSSLGADEKAIVDENTYALKRIRDLFKEKDKDAK